MSADVNDARLEELAGKVMSDIAGAMGVLAAYLGDQTGAYAALAEIGPCTYQELAAKLGTEPKYVREWLSSNAANGYVTYDGGSGKFQLTPEQETVFSTEGHPACMQGFIMSVMGQMEEHEKAVDIFRTGKGRPWDQQSSCCFCGTDRFFRPGYDANLLPNWIPAMPGVQDKLEAGAKVADIGCGRGSSTVLMAKAFPNSHFVGIDFHQPSLEEAAERAKAEGVTNVEWVHATAQDYPGDGFDFACVFDALHDMGDPVGAARHIKETLKQDGAFMLVEPLAGDSLEENMHPLGAIYYAFSTTVCTPCSLSQPVGLGLGTQAGQKRLTEVLNEAGFTQVSRAAETGSNMVLDVRH